MQSWAYQARANESVSTCNSGSNPPLTFSVEFWAAFNLLTNRSMFFDVKQLPDLNQGPGFTLEQSNGSETAYSVVETHRKVNSRRCHICNTNYINFIRHCRFT